MEFFKYKLGDVVKFVGDNPESNTFTVVNIVGRGTGHLSVLRSDSKMLYPRIHHRRLELVSRPA